MKQFIAIFMTMCLVLGLSSMSSWAAEDTAWREETAMPIFLQSFGTSVIGDKIYVIGGFTGYGGTDAVYIYDVKTATWATGASMPTKRQMLSTVAVGEKIYAIGGLLSDTVEIYDTKTDTWTTGTPMPKTNCYFAASVVGDKIYVIGGRTNNGVSNTITNAVEIYDTKTDTWTTGTPMPTARVSLSTAVVGGGIYAIGGTSSEPNSTSAVEIYDPATNTWSKGANMPTSRYGLSSVAMGEKIYAMGGMRNQSYYKNTEIYDPQTNQWTQGSSMSIDREYFGTAVVENRIYAIGGYSHAEATGRTGKTESLQVDGEGEPEIIRPTLFVLLNEGEEVQLSISYNLANNAGYMWTSTNEAIASVDGNGKVTALDVGEADIYAESADGTFKEFIPVKVVENADELRLAVHLKSGEKAKLYLTEDASKVAWKSLDETVVTISADGQVTAAKKGLAIVQGELDGKTYQIYVRVNG